MLYHYTNYVAFDGIVGNKTLRLNNVLNMNDASEMRFYMEGIRDNVMNRLKENGLQDKAYAAEHFLKNELREEFNYSAYAACFSHFRDDAAQWERYANFGQGVCISFDEEMLYRITEATGGSVTMKNVRYGQDFEHLEITDEFYRLFAESESISDNLEEFEKLMKEAWATSAAFKHPSFANENEVRMVITPSAQNDFPVQPQYHVSLGRIKKFYPMNLSELCRNAGIGMEDLIVEVMIGPTTNQSPEILKDYLRDKGYTKLAEQVMISGCPLRKPNT